MHYKIRKWSQKIIKYAPTLHDKFLLFIKQLSEKTSRLYKLGLLNNFPNDKSGILQLVRNPDEHMIKHLYAFEVVVSIYVLYKMDTHSNHIFFHYVHTDSLQLLTTDLRDSHIIISNIKILVFLILQLYTFLLHRSKLFPYFCHIIF